MAASPLTSSVGVLSLEITSAGSTIKDTYRVISVNVRNDVNRIPTATIIFADGDTATETFPASDSSDFIPGTAIVIKAGYKGTTASIFEGVVVKHTVSIDAAQGPTLEVEVKDKALKMTIARKSAYYEKKKDSDIISALISGAGLTAGTVDATTFQHPLVVQHYCTDWDLMLERAEVNGKIVIVNAGKVSVAKPDVSSSAVLTVTNGTDLLSFNADLNTKDQLSAVQGTSWDMKTQAIVQDSGSNPSVNSQGNITSSTLADVFGVTDYGLQSSGAVDKSLLKTWADGKLLKSWMSKITGTASFQGSSLALPGTIIEFVGVGARFDGSAFVSGVEHRIEDGEWTTSVTLGLSPDWHSELTDIVAPSTAGLLPGTQGLMMGVVKQLDSDPDTEFRVLVTLPMMQADSTGVWARLSNFYSTSGAGAFFIPEIGDEVVLGFLNDDPRFPVILGSLYSSTIKPGNDVDGNAYAMDKTNPTKAIPCKRLFINPFTLFSTFLA